MTLPEFETETQAREWLKRIRWPDGPKCHHCGSENCMRMGGAVHQFDRYSCRACLGQFTVVQGTACGNSPVPLRKWFKLANEIQSGDSLLAISKRTDLTYKSVWRMAKALQADKLFSELMAA